MTDHPSLTLATFAAQLDFDAIPTAVVERTTSLYVDWLGSALAGKGARPVETIARFARQAGGGLADDPSEILINRTRTTPYFAAMVNGAASHFA
jgi:2-methylcitrate dehydratase PrpD